jgi:hypothetical protein
MLRIYQAVYFPPKAAVGLRGSNIRINKIKRFPLNREKVPNYNAFLMHLSKAD